MITRILYAIIEMYCCRDGDIIYSPLPRPIESRQTKDRFAESLLLWRDKAEYSLYNKYYQIANNECKGMGATPKLCNFSLTITNIEEEGSPTPSITEIDYIKELEKLIREAKDEVREYEEQRTDLYITPLDQWTPAHKRELNKINKEIGRLNAFIREQEDDIKKIKKQYNI